ncbi:MAG: nonstructural protein [Microvirus sp.]|nr:MAG: nonstructural protein [Microvirus sp.]
MSIKNVCSVFDSASRLFGQPFFVPALGSAMRAVGDEVNRAAADNSLYQHPEDFELYHVADFDDVHGKFIVLDSPKLLARLKDLTTSHAQVASLAN